MSSGHIQITGQRGRIARNAYTLSKSSATMTDGAVLGQMPDPWRLAAIAGQLIGCATASIHVVRPPDPVFSRAIENAAGQPKPGTLAHAVVRLKRRIVVSEGLNTAKRLTLIEAMAFPQAHFLWGEPLWAPRRKQPVGALTLLDYEPRVAPTETEMEDVACLAQVIAGLLASGDHLPR